MSTSQKTDLNKGDISGWINSITRSS